MFLQMDTFRGIRAIGGRISSIFPAPLSGRGKEQPKGIVIRILGIWMCIIPI
jgi:hypothetical protein